MKLDFFSIDFRQNTPVSKFTKNPSSGSRVAPCGRTDRQAGMTKLTAVFRRFSQTRLKTERMTESGTAMWTVQNLQWFKFIQRYWWSLKLCWIWRRTIWHRVNGVSDKTVSSIFRKVQAFLEEVKAARSPETSVTKRPMVRTSDPRKFQSIQTPAWRDCVFMYNLLKDAVDIWDYTALNDTLIDPFYPKRST
jgi:hypothetical protein